MLEQGALDASDLSSRLDEKQKAIEDKETHNRIQGGVKIPSFGEFDSMSS